MKLYILKILSTNKIFAITEYLYHMKLFIIQNNFSNNEYSIEVLKNENKINKYLIRYDDLYITEYKKFAIRNKDRYILEDIIYQEKKKIYESINLLESINESCIMKLKDHKLISKCICLLEDKSSKKNIDDFININEIIRDYFNNHTIRQSIEDLYDRFHYHINS